MAGQTTFSIARIEYAAFRAGTFLRSDG